MLVELGKEYSYIRNNTDLLSSVSSVFEMFKINV